MTPAAIVAFSGLAWLLLRGRSSTAAALDLPSGGHDGVVPSRHAPPRAARRASSSAPALPAPAEVPASFPTDTVETEAARVARFPAPAASSSRSSSRSSSAPSATRAQVAAAQAAVVTLAQGDRDPVHVRAVQREIGARETGQLDVATRQRLAQLLGDAGEAASPSTSPAHRAARRLVIYWLGRDGQGLDPVVVRGFQSQLGVPTTGRVDLRTGLRVRELFERA